MVVRPSYLYNGNPYAWNDCIEALLLVVSGERRVVHGHTVERKDQKLAQYLRKYSISLTDGSIHPLLFVYPATPIREALEPFPEEEGAGKMNS